MNTTKIAGIVGKVLQFGIAIIGTIFFLMILLNDSTSAISYALTLSMWAIYIAAGVAVLFGVYHFAANVKENPKSIIGIVAFLVVIFVARMMAKSAVVTDALLSKADEGQLLMTDTGLYMFYILMGIAILAILFAEVSRLFK
jgi:carbon starvation protein CstA